MRTKTVLWLVIILSIATFLRLYHIKTTPPGLYPDEAMNGNNALEALRTANYKVFYPENNGREGLFIAIQAQFLKVWGNKPWALRLPSAIFGILTVLGMFFLGRELFSRNVGLLAAFLLATNFWHINFSRIGFRAILAPFFAIWAFYFFVLALHRAYERPASWSSGIYSAVAGILFGLGAYTYIAYRVLPLLAVIIFMLMWWRHRKIDKRVLHAGLHLVLWSLIIFLPLGLYFAHNPADFLGRTSQLSVSSSPHPLSDFSRNIILTLGMFNLHGDWNPRHNIPGRPELSWPVGLLFILGVILGIRSLFHSSERKYSFGIIFAWFILAALPVVISNEGIPHALRSILLIPPTILFSAAAGIWLYEFVRERLPTQSGVRGKWLQIAAVLFFVFLTFQAYQDYFITWAQSPDTPGAFAQNYVDLGNKLNNLPVSLPKYVVVKAGGTEVRGIPMPAQTVMFITDTFTPDKQKEKNIRYLLPGEEYKIPPGAYTAVVE